MNQNRPQFQALQIAADSATSLSFYPRLTPQERAELICAIERVWLGPPKQPPKIVSVELEAEAFKPTVKIQMSCDPSIPAVELRVIDKTGKTLARLVPE